MIGERVDVPGPSSHEVRWAELVCVETWPDHGLVLVWNVYEGRAFPTVGGETSVDHEKGIFLFQRRVLVPAQELWKPVAMDRALTQGHTRYGPLGRVE